MSATLATCSCGHAPTPTPWTTGYGTDAQGYTRCFPCRDDYERTLLLDRSRPFMAYVSGDGRSITSWPGGKLADVTSSRPCKLTRTSYTHDARSYRSIHARDVHGGEWYGRGSPGIAITLRPCKSLERAP